METKKLTIEQFESLMDEVIDEFNFEKVERIMRDLDWKWSKGAIEHGEYYQPTVVELKRTARRLLRVAFREEETIESGGFQARYVPPLAEDESEENVPYLRLGFLVEWSETAC